MEKHSLTDTADYQTAMAIRRQRYRTLQAVRYIGRYRRGQQALSGPPQPEGELTVANAAGGSEHAYVMARRTELTSRHSLSWMPDRAAVYVGRGDVKEEESCMEGKVIPVQSLSIQLQME